MSAKKLMKYFYQNCINQRAFALRLGTSPNNLSRLVNGRQSISLDLAYRIEVLTKGEISIYDWIENKEEQSYSIKKRNSPKRDINEKS